MGMFCKANTGPINLELVSPDAGVDEQNGGMSHYLVDVAIEGDLTPETSEIVTFIPGMTATVDVLSGTRTVLEYFW